MQERTSNFPSRAILCALALTGLAATLAATGPENISNVTGRGGKSALHYDGSLLVQLRVADLERAIAFYRDVLDFEVVLRDDSLSWAKVSPGIPGVRIGLGTGPEPKGSGSLSLNLGVADIAAARALLESRGVRFRGDTLTIPGVVKLADFSDPDGHRIRLAEDLK